MPNPVVRVLFLAAAIILASPAAAFESSIVDQNGYALVPSPDCDRRVPCSLVYGPRNQRVPAEWQIGTVPGWNALIVHERLELFLYVDEHGRLMLGRDQRHMPQALWSVGHSGGPWWTLASKTRGDIKVGGGMVTLRDHSGRAREGNEIRNLQAQDLETVETRFADELEAQRRRQAEAQRQWEEQQRRALAEQQRQERIRQEREAHARREREQAARERLDYLFARLDQTSGDRDRLPLLREILEGSMFSLARKQRSDEHGTDFGELWREYIRLDGGNVVDRSGLRRDLDIDDGRRLDGGGLRAQAGYGTSSNYRPPPTLTTCTGGIVVFASDDSLRGVYRLSEVSQTRVSYQRYLASWYDPSPLDNPDQQPLLETIRYRSDRPHDTDWQLIDAWGRRVDIRYDRDTPLGQWETITARCAGD